VRALLALSVVFVTCWLTVHGEVVPAAVNEALFASLAYYCATRGLVSLSPDVLRRLEAEGVVPADPRPLFLPRGTVRLLIVLAFLGLAGYLVKERGWRHLLSATTLLLVLAFLAGQVLKWLLRWAGRKAPPGQVPRIEHLKAACALAACAMFVVLFVTGTHRDVPPWFHQASLAVMVFYFGSR